MKKDIKTVESNIMLYVNYASINNKTDGRSVGRGKRDMGEGPQIID